MKCPQSAQSWLQNRRILLIYRELQRFCGESEIRTRGRVTPTTV